MNKHLIKNNLPSFCTANFNVIKILIIFAKRYNLPILLESTSNQVNQFGGYTGLKPKELDGESLLFRNLYFFSNSKISSLSASKEASLSFGLLFCLTR